MRIRRINFKFDERLQGHQKQQQQGARRKRLIRLIQKHQMMLTNQNIQINLQDELEYCDD